jgi:uncharacterized protein YegJ (DUF2314 family)
MNTSRFHLLLILPLLAAGCATTQKVQHPMAREVVRRSGCPACYYVKDEDVDMRDAVRMARKNEGMFIAALQHPSPTQRDFEVKKPFVQGAEMEHIWLSHVTYTGNRFTGRVDNYPVKITGVKMGVRVSVNPDEITDWAYVDDGKLVGGYTIRALYKNLSPDLRKEFERENRFRITEY